MNLSQLAFFSRLTQFQRQELILHRREMRRKKPTKPIIKRKTTLRKKKVSLSPMEMIKSMPPELRQKLLDELSKQAGSF